MSSLTTGSAYIASFLMGLPLAYLIGDRYLRRLHPAPLPPYYVRRGKATELGKVSPAEEAGEAVLRCVRDLIPCAACALFLPEGDGVHLRVWLAEGEHKEHLLGQRARIGVGVTGAAFAQGEATRSNLMAEPLLPQSGNELPSPFRSVLVVPLTVGPQALGTLNFYSPEPNAFEAEAKQLAPTLASLVACAVENVQALAQAQEDAFTDPLTGLRNRRFLVEQLKAEINRAQREGVSLAVLNMDLDHFKEVNDRLGHLRGDETLQQIAALFTHYIRDYDIVARYAGDEFVVILSRTSRTGARMAATKLRLALARYVRYQQSQEANFPNLGLSIGVALYPDDAEDITGLLSYSDAAMYAEKEAHHSIRPAA